MSLTAKMKTFLLTAIGELIGCEPDAEIIARALYKYSSCGCWVKFDDEGIEIGTIVEGSDAEYSERLDMDGVTMDEAGAYTLVARWRGAVQNCIDFANEHHPESAEDTEDMPATVPPGMELGHEFTLRDDEDDPEGKKLIKGRVFEEGRVQDNAQGLAITLDGFGVMTMLPGFGPVVYLEYYEGKVRLHVWADINNEEPTHTIDLSGALETNRKPEPEPTMTCAGCNKGIWMRDSYSPPGTDEALCAECDTAVTGRKHRPTLPLNEDGLKQLRKEFDEQGDYVGPPADEVGH